MCGGFPSGIIQTGIFCARNTGKVMHGDVGRTGVVAMQATSVADSVANSASIFGDRIAGAASGALGAVDKGIMSIAEKAGCSEAVSKLAEKAGTNSIFGAVARKAVNPLLVGAAGIRVLKDEDQYAALIEETSAMGLMFGVEKLMKSQRNNFYKLAENAAVSVSEGVTKEAAQTAKNALEGAVNSGGIKKVLAGAAKKFSGLSKGKQTAIKVGLEILFVAGSIAGYSIGKNIGKKLSGRDEETSKS